MIFPAALHKKMYDVSLNFQNKMPHRLKKYLIDILK